MTTSQYANKLLRKNHELEMQLRAAIRLLTQHSRISYGWNDKLREYGYYLDFKYAGSCLEDCVRLERRSLK